MGKLSVKVVVLSNQLWRLLIHFSDWNCFCFEHVLQNSNMVRCSHNWAQHSDAPVPATVRDKNMSLFTSTIIHQLAFFLYVPVLMHEDSKVYQEC